MFSIIVGFPKMDDAACIRNVLLRGGYNVSDACTLGAQIVGIANNLDEGIVVCGYRFSDMHYSEINDYLPQGFEMLLVASPEKLEYCQDNGIICLPMPIKTNDLLNTLQMMCCRYQKKKKDRGKPKPRTEEEKGIIQKAKYILMDRNNMTEEEAHHYLQKTSMDNHINLVEMSEILIKTLYP